MKLRFTARRVVIGAVLAAASPAASGGTTVIGSIAGPSTNAGR